MQKISRKDALTQGLKFYFTGKPCSNGHVSKRHVENWTCWQCARDLQNVQQKNRSRKSVDLSLDQIRRRSISATNHNNKRKNRVPIWSETEAIKQFYLDCPEGYQVDHIIPLQGTLVSGLHVLGNLQYLTVSENRSKSNHFEV